MARAPSGKLNSPSSETEPAAIRIDRVTTFAPMMRASVARIVLGASDVRSELAEREERVRREPVLAHVVPGDVGEARREVVLRRLERELTTRISVREGTSQAAPAPRAAQI